MYKHKEAIEISIYVNKTYINTTNSNSKKLIKICIMDFIMDSFEPIQNEDSDMDKNNNEEEGDSYEKPEEPMIPMPMQNFYQLEDAIEKCNKPLCADDDMECIYDLINATLCEAIQIIESDPRGLFCYKYPTDFKTCIFEQEVMDAITQMTNTSDLSVQGSNRLWMKIRNFEYSNVIPLIRDYISHWYLSPETKCVVLSNTKKHDVPLKGTIHFIDAHFSRPTPSCPNPLAVAKVRFIVTVSKVMQSYYPIMITYRFEGFRTLFYAVGERAIFSNTFQRYYIDTIVHTKLSFYAEICECRHGTIENPKVVEDPKDEQTKDKAKESI